MEFSLEDDEIYQMQCGEMFFTTKGRLIFHCTLCEKKFNGFDMYETHIKEHITTNFSDEHEHDVNNDLDDFIQFEENDLSSNEHDSFPISPTVKIENYEADEALKEEEIVMADIKKQKQYNLEKSRAKSIKTHINNNPTINKKPIKTEKPKEKTNDDLIVPIAVRDVQPRIFPRSYLTPEEERKHRCPVCNTGFKDRHNMVYHLKRHSDQKDHKCPECGKAFYTNSEVRIHLRSHKNERPYLCSECGRSYVSNSHLLAHLKRHANQRNYRCHLCDKAFFDKSQLMGHMVGHSSERPFSCEICGADFTRQKALKNHLKLHENKKEYKCELCDSQFNQRAGLFSHMKTAHKMI